MKLNQKKAPLFDALKKYSKSNMVAYHTPGHKQGQGIYEDFLKLVGKEIFKIDLTELDELDNLHDAQGVIQKAQRLAADLYGADESFFLVNGSTVGNHVMIMTICNQGDKIIVPRNTHKSVIGGIILSGAIPVYLPSVWNNSLGIVDGIDIKILEKTILENPDVKGVLLVNPSYYGTCLDLKKSIKLIHKYNLPVLVDEAHGAHFKFHKELPLSALEGGADMVVQSTHKMLTSMTQSSMLHVKRERINVSKLKSILKLLQSSSPSYLLMASLDIARKQMATKGEALLDKTIELCNYAQKKLNKIKGIKTINKENCKDFGIYDIDPTKLIIDFSELGISGFRAIDILCDDYGIQSEMATIFNVLELVTIGNKKPELDKLIKAVEDIANRPDIEKDFPLNLKLPIIPSVPNLEVSPRDAFFSETESVVLNKAVNRISAEVIAPYPPGIPILVSGEKITKEVISYLETLNKYGVFVSGIEYTKLTKVKVLRNSNKVLKKIL